MSTNTVISQNTDDIYFNKYLKYKTKYIELQKIKHLNNSNFNKLNLSRDLDDSYIMSLHLSAENGEPIEIINNIQGGFGKSKEYVYDTLVKYLNGMLNDKEINNFKEFLGKSKSDEGKMWKDNKGRTPLHLAAENTNITLDKYVEIVKLLVEGEGGKAKIMKDKGNRTPLHLAAKNLQIALLMNSQISLNIINILMEGEEGEKAKTMPDREGCVPLHYAAQNENISLYFITNLVKGVDKYAKKMQDNKSWTPLHYAATNPNITRAIIRVLVSGDEGKNAKIMQDKEGCRTPLHLAVNNTNIKPEIIQELASDLEGEKAKIMQDNTGKTPLHYAAAIPNISLDVIKSLMTRMGGQYAAKNILDFPPKTRNRNAIGRTPLDYANKTLGISPDIKKLLA